MAKQSGLSPPVRGNLQFSIEVGSDRGSIPACAGEPGLSQSLIARSTVYPRLCGGTGITLLAGWLSVGLSPPVRGNHPGCAGDPPLRRSIPACAGEPPAAPFCPDFPPVYPRLCGGTMDGIDDCRL